MANNSKSTSGNERIKETGFTVFVTPFWYDNDLSCQHLSLWETDNNALSTEGDAGDVLYPYIMDFLQGQVPNKATLHSDSLKILSLIRDEQSDRYKLFWRFISQMCVAKISDGTKIPFRIIDSPSERILNPHLFIYEAAKIGVLTFCVKLSNYSFEDQKTLNYCLHKISGVGDDFTCECSYLQMNPRMDFDTEEKRKSKENEIVKGRSYLPGNNNDDPNSPFSFSIRQIIEMWLTDISGIHLFSNWRSQVFSYSLLDGTGDQGIDDSDIKLDALRIARCVNDKYLIINGKNGGDEVLNTFENIYIASSCEGTAIIAVAKEENKGFMENFKAVIRDRYFWIYLLAVIQRTTQQRIIQDLTKNESLLDIPLLKGVYDLIQKVRLNCFFTDISPFTQHNQFYHYLCASMSIGDRFKEIDCKMQILDQTIRKRHDDESESKQRALSVLVGVLTLFQVGDAIFALSNGASWDHYLPCIIGMLVFAAIIVFIFRKDIGRIFRKK